MDVNLQEQFRYIILLIWLHYKYVLFNILLVSQNDLFIQ